MFNDLVIARGHVAPTTPSGESDVRQDGHIARGHRLDELDWLKRTGLERYCDSAVPLDTPRFHVRQQARYVAQRQRFWCVQYDPRTPGRHLYGEKVVAGDAAVIQRGRVAQYVLLLYHSSGGDGGERPLQLASVREHIGLAAGHRMLGQRLGVQYVGNPVGGYHTRADHRPRLVPWGPILLRRRPTLATHLSDDPVHEAPR